MFRRLLFSYVLVIGTVLLIMAVALPLVLGRLRDQVTFSQLQLAGRLVEVETGRLRRQGGDAARIGRVLNALAENQDRRFFLVEPQNSRVIFDTAPEPNWVGQSLADIGRIPGSRLLDRALNVDGLPGQADFYRTVFCVARVQLKETEEKNVNLSESASPPDASVRGIR